MRRLFALCLLLATPVFAADPTFVGTNTLTTTAQQSKGVWYASTSASGVPDHGNAAVQGSLAWIKTKIGTTHTWVDLPPGTYTIATNFDTGAYLHLRPQPGAMLTRSGSATLAISASFQAPLTKWLSGWTAGLTILVPGQAIYSQWFGAVGDGIADDSAALKAIVAVVNAASGGIVYFSKGTYLLSWDVGVSSPGNPFLNCTGLSIIGNGAILKIKDGSLNKNNWNQINTYGLAFQNCTDVHVTGITVNGNNLNLTYETNPAYPGSGTSTYESVGCGFVFYNCKRVTMDRCYSYNAGSDGIYIGAIDLSSYSSQVFVTNCEFTNSRRHAITVAAAYDVVFSNCLMKNASNVPGAPAPGVGSMNIAFGGGVDVEPNPGGYGAENITFIGCRFLNNLSAGAYQTGGVPGSMTKNVLYRACVFESTVGPAIRILQETTTVERSQIRGQVKDFYGVMRDCDVTVTGTYYYDPANPHALRLTNSGRAIVDNVRVTAADNAKLIYSNGSTTEPTRKFIRNCTFEHTGNAIADTSSIGYIQDFTTIENSFFTQSGTMPATGYFIQIGYPGGTLSAGLTADASNKIFFYDMATGHSTPGRLWPEEGALQAKQLHLIPAYDPAAKIHIAVGIAAPVAGTWVRGDRMINSQPAVGNPKGWTCTVGGTPGTWVSEGNL